MCIHTYAHKNMERIFNASCLVPPHLYIVILQFGFLNGCKVDNYVCEVDKWRIGPSNSMKTSLVSVRVKNEKQCCLPSFRTVNP